jgi:hypothetical protein
MVEGRPNHWFSELNKVRTAFLCLFAAALPAFSAFAAEKDQPTGLSFHDDYASEAEVPEPLLFDLVRRLGAQQGEFEANVLFRVEESTDLGALRFAPEIEFAVLDGFAVELELPMQGNRVEALKAAVQWTLGSLGPTRQIRQGLQLIAERRLDREELEVTPLYIFGHRLAPAYSYLLIAGVLAEIPLAFGRVHWVPVLNGTFFYNYSREIDLGLEVNLQGVLGSYRDLRILPQLHLLLRTDWKIQMGFGLLQRAGQWQGSTAFRLIKEFND